MPKSSSLKHVIVAGNEKKPSYIKSFDFEKRSVTWTQNRTEAQRLGPTDISLVSSFLREKMDFQVTKESHLKLVG